MERILLKSKIHLAAVTATNLHYEGSLTLDPHLMEAADLLPYEQVHVFNLSNGNRFITYVMEGKGGSGGVEVNGAAVHLTKEGDLLIIASFASYSEAEARHHRPKLVFVDEQNRVISYG